jgi:hypothetical protein
VKKVVLIIVSFLAFVVAVLLLAATSKSNNQFIEKLAVATGVRTENLITNPNFDENFKAWKHDRNVSLINTNGVKYIRIEGNDKNQTRLWQDLNLTTGKYYKLKFNVISKGIGAFIIYYDPNIKKEKYLWINRGKDIQTYYWDIQPKSTGIKSLYFSTNKEGVFYYFNISMYGINEELIKIYKLISLFIFLCIATLILVFELDNINIYFSIAIITLSILPLFKISKQEKSKKENRTLSIYKPIFINGKLNKTYGLDFNNWLNDRFFLRGQLLDYNTDIKYIIDRKLENELAFQGRNGWLFQKLNTERFIVKKSDYKNIVIQMKSFSEHCKKEFNIPVYYAIIPEKNTIYNEYQLNNLYNTEPLANQLSEENDIQITYFLEVLKKGKEKQYVCFKEDHHWTQFGALLSCQNIIEKIRKQNPDIPEINESDFKTKIFTNAYKNIITTQTLNCSPTDGTIFNQLNLNKNIYKYQNHYLTFESIKYGIPRAIFPTKKPFFSSYKNAKINSKRIMVIGDSNIGYMVPFVFSAFSESIFYQVNDARNNWYNNWDMHSYLEMIEKHKPDIILLISRSENLKSWMNLWH